MSSPIIPWMGGKRRLADCLIPLFPPHECYVEVFAGGGALYFLRPQAAPCEVLNDINGDLVTLYRVVQNWTAPAAIDNFQPHNEALSKASGLTPPRWL